MRTKNSRNLAKEDKEKIAKELRNGATFKELKEKYGMKSDTPFRKICKEYNINYIPAYQRNKDISLFETDNETDLFSEIDVKISYDIGTGLFVLKQGKSEIYMGFDEVRGMFGSFIDSWKQSVEEKYGTE